MKWSGFHTGERECLEFGWTVGPEFPDLNRVRFPFARWNSVAARWEKDPGAPPAGSQLGGLWKATDSQGRWALFDLSYAVTKLPEGERRDAEERLAQLVDDQDRPLQEFIDALQMTREQLLEHMVRDWHPPVGDRANQGSSSKAMPPQ